MAECGGLATRQPRLPRHRSIDAAGDECTAGIVKSWNEAVAYYEAHPDESIAIMAKGVGGWLKNPKDFKETLPGIKFYDAAANKAFFGTAAAPGPLANTVQAAIDIWSSHGKLQVKPTASDLINYSYVNE